MNLLNIGCGNTIHSDWVNVDIASENKEVKVHDLLNGLPFEDGSFDACYSSHFLEHLTVRQAQKIVEEVFRVLKPQGVFRVVVPDLESTALVYLEKLEQASSGVVESEADYDWMMLELYDQSVRCTNAGAMKGFLSNPSIKNKEFVLSRLGEEAEKYWERSRNPQTMWEKLKAKNIRWFVQRLQLGLAEFVVLLLAGKKGQKSLRQGFFRNSGEIHQWMYDRFSLQRLLANSGFAKITACSAETSLIPDFSDYRLDSENGKVRRPNSLFMEGVKS